MNILVIGKAKTGTTVISKAIQHSLPGSSYHLEPKEICFFESEKHLKRDNVVKIIFEHWSDRPSLRNAILRNETKLKFDRIVSVVRDPRDELISRLFYISRPLAHRGVSEDKMQQWIAFINTKEKDPKGVSFLSMMTKLNELFGTDMKATPGKDANYFTWVQRHLEVAHVLKYEDFMRGDVGGLEAYLGFSLSDNRDLGQLTYTKRSANYNNWKRYFSPEDVAALRPVYMPLLCAWGYNDWELEDCASIDPAEASEYVRRIFDEAAAIRATRV